MNAFVAISLIAFAATVSAGPFDQYNPDSSARDIMGEVDALDNVHQELAPFCVIARNFIISDVEENSNGLHSKMIGDFFLSHDNLILSKLSKSEVRQAAPTTGADNIFKGFVQGFENIGAAANKVVKQLNDWKEQFGVFAVNGVLKGFCDSANRYNELLHAQYDKYSAARRYPAQVDEVKLEELKCQTVARVVRAAAICRERQLQ